MGNWISQLWSKLVGLEEVKMIVLGLDNAGKTTTLYKLCLGKTIKTQPTIGSNVEQVKYENINFQMWDLGGQESIRNSWAVYYLNTQVIILVVDSSDRDRIGILKEELFSFLPHPDLASAKVLVFANKQDKEGAMKPAEVSQALHLHKIRSHDWHIAGCCALTGEGLKEGLDWVVEKLRQK
mmetsp:Transcript_2818/g.4059  ORF Transcript_2818/g.4059 Transcript_2818/m.4059 type:complete len:181 (-) Transcript_2818:691-1233(-)